MVNCTPQCSVSPDKLGVENARIVHGWLEDRMSAAAIISRAATELSSKISNGALGRHSSRHLRIVDDKTVSVGTEDSKVGVATDLEVLEGIISAGWRNSTNWHPSIQDTLKAMDMKYKLTQGSVFDEFFEAISGAQMDEEEGPPENPEALTDIPDGVET